MIITLSSVFVDFITICILQGATHMIIGTLPLIKTKLTDPKKYVNQLNTMIFELIKIT